ncbi:hypothetical protein A9Z61_09340 [Moraxella osloensis]|nr:DUF4258 domain-containing protein [Moraxella osloensis]OBX55283.1 hypothetical protein A9Z61_09340 [Moraxella osloensis]
MNITYHAKCRMKQRRISESMINLALMFGKEIKNTDKVVLCQDDINQLYQATFQLIKKLETA